MNASCLCFPEKGAYALKWFLICLQSVDDCTKGWWFPASLVQTENHQCFRVRERTLIYFWEKKGAAFCNCLLWDHRHKNAFVTLFMGIRQPCVVLVPGNETDSGRRKQRTSKFVTGWCSEAKPWVFSVERTPTARVRNIIWEIWLRLRGLPPPIKICRETRELCICRESKYVFPLVISLKKTEMWNAVTVVCRRVQNRGLSCARTWFRQ